MNTTAVNTILKLIFVWGYFTKVLKLLWNLFVGLQVTTWETEASREGAEKVPRSLIHVLQSTDCSCWPDCLKSSAIRRVLARGSVHQDKFLPILCWVKQEELSVNRESTLNIRIHSSTLDFPGMTAALREDFDPLEKRVTHRKGRANCLLLLIFY